MAKVEAYYYLGENRWSAPSYGVCPAARGMRHRTDTSAV